MVGNLLWMGGYQSSPWFAESKSGASSPRFNQNPKVGSRRRDHSRWFERPPYKAKSGVIALAKVSKYPILLLSFKYNSCFRINSWDRFILPLPFSRVEVSSQLIFHKDLLASQGVEEATRLVETKLNQMSSD